MRKVAQITMEGGVIQDVRCPEGVKVVIHDYDVDGADEGLQRDDNGDPFIESVWE